MDPRGPGARSAPAAHDGGAPPLFPFTGFRGNTKGNRGLGHRLSDDPAGQALEISGRGYVANNPGGKRIRGPPGRVAIPIRGNRTTRTQGAPNGPGTNAAAGGHQTRGHSQLCQTLPDGTADVSRHGFWGVRTWGGQNDSRDRTASNGGGGPGFYGAGAHGEVKGPKAGFGASGTTQELPLVGTCCPGGAGDRRF